MIKPIITSMLDQDYYSYLVGQLVHKLYPTVQVKYKFYNRLDTQFPDGFDTELKNQIDMMALLSYSLSDYTFLKDQNKFSKNYLRWIASYRYDPSEVTITQNHGSLEVNIEGFWSRTIYWEVPLLRVISALYYKMTGQQADIEWETTVKQKAQAILAHKLKVYDFGSRRAYSPEKHHDTIEILDKYAGTKNHMSFASDFGFCGTSNVQLAKEFNIPCSGTNSHQWIMGHAAMFGVELSNQIAVETWLREYHGKNLNTVLPDTYTTGYFLSLLNENTLRQIDTFRQDSGDPIKIGEMIVKKLNDLGAINLQNSWEGRPKTILFSDSLTVYKAKDIKEHFKHSGVKTIFGIGTSLTNDVGVEPLSIVFKPVSFKIPYHNPNMETTHNGDIEVCKISDDRGKYSGSPSAIAHALTVINGENN